MKYFLIGAFATGILLYGIALVYGATGTTKLTEIGAMIGGSGASVAGLVDASQQAALVAAAGFDESVPAGLHDFGGMLMHVPLLSIGVVLSSSASASSWPPCCICGRRTSTPARPHPSSALWPRR